MFLTLFSPLQLQQMSSAEVSASEFLRDLSQRTSYLFDWRENESKIQRTTSLDLRQHCDHISLNRQVLKRQPSKRYGLKQWEGRQNLIHKIEYPINQGGPCDVQQAFLSSKLCFHHQSPTLSPQNKQSSKKIAASSKGIVALTIAKAEREIIQKREAELQKVATCRSNFCPKDKLLPSIPIKRSKGDRTSQINDQTPRNGKQAGRLSLPSFHHHQHQQSIIKLIQY